MKLKILAALAALVLGVVFVLALHPCTKALQ